MRHTLLAHLWAQLVLAVAVVVVANHVSAAWFLRADLTEDQRYTLSPVGRELMTGLERPLVARVYFTPDLEAPYNNHEQGVLDLLEELRAWSGGRLEIQRIDPSASREAVEEAQAYGISPIPYRYQDWQGAELREVYLGVSFVYGDRQAAADALVSLESAEYELLRAIATVTRDPEDRRTVGYLQGDGEPDLAQFPADNPMGALRDHLLLTTELVPVTLGGDEGVPPDVDALLVIGPQQPLTDRAQYQLDQFLMGGGAAALYISSLRPDFASMRVDTVRHGLGPMLAHYGVQLGKAVLIDRTHNERIPLPIVVGRRRTMVQLNYPLVPSTSRLNRGVHPVRRVEKAVLPFTTPVALADELPAGVEGQVWVETMPESSAVDGLVHITYEALQAPPMGEETGSFPVAVGLQGRLTSFFADRPIPPPVGREVAPDDPLEKLVDGEPSRLFVAGSADFVANNIEIVQNTIDWLLEDELLIDVRARQVSVAPLERIDAATAWKHKLLVVLVPLSLLWIVSAVLLLRRRTS